jgi:hypothetical protein
MCHWSIYRLFVLHTGRKLDSLQMIIIVNVCSSWSIFQLKTRFEASITTKDVNGVTFFHLPNLITLGLPVLTMDTKCPNQVLYDWLVLNRGWKRDSPNNDIRICLLDMRHSWTKNDLRDVNYKKWRKWSKFVSLFLFNNTYGLPVFKMETKSPNQVCHDWEVDLQAFVLNSGWN